MPTLKALAHVLTTAGATYLAAIVLLLLARIILRAAIAIVELVADVLR